MSGKVERTNTNHLMWYHVAIIFIILTVLFMPLDITFAEDEHDCNSTKVLINLSETRDIVPDIYTVYVTVNVTTQKEVEAINILGLIDRAVKDLNLKYKGGRYSVNKKCWWEKGKEKCLGYTGNVYYNFELDEPEKQNHVFETLTEFQEKYGDRISISISNPGWIVSKKILKKTEEELKFEIMDSARSFAKKVSEKLGQNCSLSEINYSTRRPSPVYPVPERTVLRDTSGIEAPEPVREEKTISVDASIRVTCK